MIHWGDETGIPNRDRVGRTCAPCGRTPVVVSRTAERITRSMIAAVGHRGLMRFMLHEGASNVDRVLAFLRRLIKAAGQKVFPIIDDLQVHQAREVKA